MLKGRFRSLTLLRSSIHRDEDVTLASMHISACVVLHNILTRSGLDDPFARQIERDMLNIPHNQHAPGHNGVVIGGDGVFTNAQLNDNRTQGREKRAQLMQIIL